jgi:hypothetical protein
MNRSAQIIYETAYFKLVDQNPSREANNLSVSPEMSVKFEILMAVKASDVALLGYDAAPCGLVSRYQPLKIIIMSPSS